MMREELLRAEAEYSSTLVHGRAENLQKRIRQQQNTPARSRKGGGQNCTTLSRWNKPPGLTLANGLDDVAVVARSPDVHAQFLVPPTD